MKCTPILFLLLFVFACKKDDSIERALKARACMNLYFDIDRGVHHFLEEASLSEQPGIAGAAADLKRIVSWRKSYYKSRSNQNLLIYTDSVLQRYRKIERTDKDVIHYLKKGKASLSAIDSTTSLDLLYWTLVAEQGVYENYAHQFPDGHRYASSIPCYMPQEKFVLGDTVMIFAELHFRRFDDALPLDFSGLECRNLATNDVATARVIDAGPFHILRYLPKSRGKYIVKGKVKIGEDARLTLQEDFIVK